MTITQAVITIVSAALGSGALFTFAQFMINRHDKKHDRSAANEAKLDQLTESVEKLRQDDIEQKKDLLRIQLAQLMSDFPDNTAEIFELAHRYFVDYNGNSFIKSLFIDWMKKQNLKQPIWFNYTK